jgi:hypothetical protein
MTRELLLAKRQQESLEIRQPLALATCQPE